MATRLRFQSPSSQGNGQNLRTLQAEVVKAAFRTNGKEEIGRGAFGRVFKTVMEPWGSVAVKEIRGNDMTECKGEAETLQRLQHENVVPFYAVAQSEENFFVITKRMDGSLEDLIKDVDRLPLAMRYRAAYQAASGLGYMHSQGVLHMDVKPSNLLIDIHGDNITARWTDFGLARSFDTSLARNTVYGDVAMGTMGYVPPEYFDDGGNLRSPIPYSAKGDVYAFGVCIARMLSLREPYIQNGRSLTHLIDWMAEKRFSLDHVMSSQLQISGHARQLILLVQNCCKENRQDRQTMAQVNGSFISWQYGDVGDTETNESPRECKICLGESINTIFLPCRHSACCEGCTFRLMQRETPQCPLCRQTIEEFQCHEAGSPNVQHTFVARLSNRSVDPLTELNERGIAFDKIVHLMMAHRTDARVQAKACLALRNLAASANNQVQLMELGAGTAIVQAMQNHRDHAEVQWCACGALRNLAASANNQVQLMELGAGPAIVQAMRNHRDNTGVQRNACGALWNLAVNANNKVQLMELGAGTAVVQGMQNHRDNAEIQGWACGALENLAVNANNQVQLMELGAGPAVVQAMQNHRDNAEIQGWACGALENLAVNANNQVQLMELGAGTAVVQAMQNHRDNAEIQRWACSALWNLAVNANNQVQLMELGAGTAIVQAMQNHRDNAEIQGWACGALENLAVNANNKVQLMELGAGPAVVQAMQNHRDNAEMQGCACSALRNLAVNANNQVQLMEVGAGPAVVQAMQNHRDNAEIQRDARGALKTLGVNPNKRRKVV